MQDSELKNLLLETCPVRPGQEERAWKSLQQRLGKAPARSSFFVPTWRGIGLAFAAGCVTMLVGSHLISSYWPVSFASVDSETPGIYASSFYSHSAQAQVVWLNGLAPASDKPTYLDPTTVLKPVKSEDKTPSDPNRL